MEQGDVKREPADPLLADWLTVEQAAVVAGVPVSTIIAWIKAGRVPVYYVLTEPEGVH